MEDHFPAQSKLSLADARVAIIGLGLMGGSLALALQDHCKTIHGVDVDAEVIMLAERMKLCSHLHHYPFSPLPKVDLIVLATPVLTILQWIDALPTLYADPVIVLDLASTKERVMAAMAGLPEGFDPIGGHPMCGKERSSLVEAERDLFQNSVFALTPLPRTSLAARSLVTQLVETIGARPMIVNPAAHDRWVASTSHLPYLVANSLAATTPNDSAPLIGPGYRSTTRVSTSPESVMMDILKTNRSNVLAGLSDLITRLQLVETRLRNQDDAALANLLAQGRNHQKQLLLRADE